MRDFPAEVEQSMSPTRGFHGVVHVHSTRSYDGTCDYSQLRDIFTGVGLDFACMTEHIEHLGQREIDAIIADCARHSDEKFLFVPGIEMDCFTVYFLGTAPTAVDFHNNRSIYDSLHRASALCVLSHPIKAKYTYPDWILRDCDAVEIMNSKHDGRFYFRPQSEALLRGIRRTRSDVVPLIGMDFHERSQLCGLHIRLRCAGPLNQSFVLDQLKSGNVSFLNGEQLLDGIGTARRMYLRSRIRMMDASHAAHRMLGGAGIRVPRKLRHTLSSILEG